MPLSPFLTKISRVVAVITVASGGASIGAQTPPQSPDLGPIAEAPVRANRAVGLVAAVVHAGDTLLMEAHGKANLEWDVPLTVDAMFPVGSVTKQFTAVAILQLHDAGRLSLDDPIADWVPEVGTAASGVTLRHLLSHTSGIFNFNDTPQWEMNFFIPGVQRDQALDLIEVEPYQFPTGKAQAYSNSGFWLLGLVVERASDMRFEDYLQEKIFDPLGMTRSMYCDDLANVPRRAKGYNLRNGSFQPAPIVSYAWVFAPGAVCSTAGDLVTWLHALHGGSLLSAEAYDAMTTPAVLADGTPVQYGLGIKVGQTYGGISYVGHGGTAPGFRADATWYPDEQLAVVVLMNTSPTNVSPGTVGLELARTALASPRPAFSYYTGDATPFVGRYEHVAGGNRGAFTIEVSDGPEGLSFSMNGSRPRPLPWAGGRTFYGNDTATLTFRASDDGRTMTELHRDDAGNHYILVKR